MGTRASNVASSSSRASPRVPLTCSREVEAALRSGAPVVALESTIVAHGMPFPENLKTALEVEALVRTLGATPATIAVIDGVARVGLNDSELKRIAELGERCAKASRRDLAHACGTGSTAATTVSGTMALARMAGVDVFVTGGIGGVHRGGESTMDVSADLIELGRTNVAVICAGVKSILDVPRTLEVLETHGATVCAYGVDEFPAFFTRTSGSRAPLRVDTPLEAARVIDASLRLGLSNGSVFAVPIPSEHEALGQVVEQATSQALREIETRKIIGREVTPYVLKRVAELTDGASLKANIALVKNNARIGAAIAVELAKLRKGVSA
ncbi:Pseudouridine-5'-phosphate glycosidase [Ostreococcus tauri]|uniref:Pseudouridine-5'-phosphate glycosidase n=1 Tax=Ostreococcus tauri TaxID=70448 RepID=A0A090MBM3_OSTTA|nr:Pseudouridine-5'-phosphate glycosidase [Ostreococcus tauri]CEF99479.1 Pseudouridine-5'-phosphate glycosidase [Ostreococcus tauri]|eukprot:XP_022839857.1 Pseudouridine-5'-phosphate glycosidase [Ostreococcus tauri]